MDLNYLLCIIFSFRSDYFLLLEKPAFQFPTRDGYLLGKIELDFISRGILPWVIPKKQLTLVITRISFILNQDTD